MKLSRFIRKKVLVDKYSVLAIVIIDWLKFINISLALKLRFTVKKNQCCRTHVKCNQSNTNTEETLHQSYALSMLLNYMASNLQNSLVLYIWGQKY